MVFADYFEIQKILVNKYIKGLALDILGNDQIPLHFDEYPH